MSGLTDQNAPRFIYWKFAARAQTSMLILRAANVNYVWDTDTANTWPKPKENMPFGQLPVLVHNGRVIAQSNTIARYCARLSGLWPTKTDEWLKADMIMEHCNDIYSLMSKAKYAGNENQQKKAWAELAEKKYPEHLSWLVKMLGLDDYFGGEKPNAGDVAVFSVLNLASRAGIATPLEKYPTLMKHSKLISEMGTINEYLNQENPRYLTVPKEEEETNTATN